MTFELAAPDDIVRAALLSADRVYRYALSRTWDPGTETLGFVMLNPSTADADIDDATIRRCMGFARRAGFGGIRVVNLFAYRATYPVDLLAAHRRGVDIVGPENDAQLSRFQDSAVVVAWGSRFGERDWHYARVEQTVRILASLNTRLLALGYTREGFPRHPLYVRGDVLLERYGEVWSNGAPPGGMICAVCGIPVESEPCPEHGSITKPEEGL